MGKNKGRKNKHHIPSAARTAERPEKVPRVGENVDFWKSKPVWSFALLDLVAPHGGWIHLRPEELDDLLARFRKWETMTWGEILSDGRKQNHPIDVIKCIPAAQERLKDRGLGDYEQLISLSVNSTARVIGILDRGIFRLLWWDPGHQICPSQLKHT